MSPRPRIAVAFANAGSPARDVVSRAYCLVLPIAAAAALAIPWRVASSGAWPLLLALGGTLVLAAIFAASLVLIRLPPFPLAGPRPRSKAITSPGRASPAQRCWQLLARTRSAQGIEIASGWQRVHFAAGQKLAVIHVPFCPPFSHAPSVQVSSWGDGGTTRVRVTHAWPHGARIELRVQEPPARAMTKWARFIARSPERMRPGGMCDARGE